MKSNKELFKAFINKEINDSDLREFALYLTDEIPEYFWTIPASSSGKYHPITDLGEGGLVRHSLMVARIALDLFNTTINVTILDMKDEIIFACLFHDCCKNGLKNSGHTEHTHPLIATEFIEKIYNHYVISFETDLSMVKVENINEMIVSHMGKWTTSKYSNVELPAPIFTEEIFVHQCDYIASRRYCLFDEEFFEKY